MTWRINTLMYGTAVVLSSIVALFVFTTSMHIGTIAGSLLGGGAAVAGLTVGGLVGSAWQDRVDGGSHR